MAELIGINTPILPTQPIENIDFTPMLMQVGNELNRKYYENRQAHLENITALSKIEASEYGQELLNGLKSEFNQSSAEFEESGMWHKADDFNFEMTKKLLTDPRIPAIAKDKAQYDAFKKELADSKWESTYKVGMMNMAKAQSSNLELKDGVVIGGFSPVQVGEPYDIQKRLDDALKIVSDAKANKESAAQFINDPNALRALGIPEEIDPITGQPVFAKFVKRKSTTESVTWDDVTNAVMLYVKSDKKYITEHKRLSLLERFAYDFDETTKSLKDYTPEKTKEIIAHDYMTPGSSIKILNNIENELGIDRTSILSKNSKTGKLEINYTKVNKLTQANNECVAKYGVTLEQLYKQGVTEDIKNKFIDNYVNSTINLEVGSDPNIEGYNDKLQSYLFNCDAKNQLLDGITNTANVAGLLYAYNNIEYDYDIDTNSAYDELVKYKYKSVFGTPLNSDPNDLNTRLAEGELVSIGSIIESDLNNTNKVSEEINKVNIQNNRIVDKLIKTQNEYLKNNGLTTNVDGVVTVDMKKVSSLDLITLDTKAREDGYYETPEYQDFRNSIVSLQSNNIKINEFKEVQNLYRTNANKLYEEYNKEKKKYQGYDWYGVGSDVAKFIANNNITNVEEFKEAILGSTQTISSSGVGGMFGSTTTYMLKDPKNNTYTGDKNYNYLKAMSDEDIQKEIRNVLDNIENTYQMINSTPFNFETPTYTIKGNSRIDRRVTERVSDWAGGDGSPEITYLPGNAKLKHINTQDLQEILKLNQFPVSISVGPKGTTTTTRNIANTNSKPIIGEKFGYNQPIYESYVVQTFDPTEAAQGYKTYEIHCKGISGTELGEPIKIREKDSTYHLDLIDVYDSLEPGVDMNDPYAAQNMGKLVQMENAIGYTFEGVLGQGESSTTTADNVFKLEADLQNRYAQHKPKSIYNIKVKNPLTNGDLINIPIKITVNNVQGNLEYYIEDLSPANAKNKGIFNVTDLAAHPRYRICETKWDGETPFTSVADALDEFSEWTLRMISIARTMQPKR